VQQVEEAVLTVLSGVSPATAAAQVGVTAADLADAVALYKRAGHAALATQPECDDWYQVYVQFSDWETAEHVVATQLWPRLREAETGGVVSAWWYIRKAPCWRLRFRAGSAGPAAMKRRLASVHDELAARGRIARWWPTSYEPETSAFGGPLGIATAHRLFHADSSRILEYLSRPTPDAGVRIGRREMSVLLCTALMRAATLDWHEQGDVWHRVTLMRRLPPETATVRPTTVTGQIRKLLSLDTSPPSNLGHDDGPLASARTWLAAFTDAGHALGQAAHEGALWRGLRDVLAHHVIFHWNRLGLTTATQAVLAQAAYAAVLNPTDRRPDPGTDVATT
jgi:thiopeptide-type bacteriocin biosynthesis protein